MSDDGESTNNVTMGVIRLGRIMVIGLAGKLSHSCENYGRRNVKIANERKWRFNP